jgi:hypothetical protein
MTSFVKEYLFEVNEFPKYGKHYELHTIKDYFFYDSNVQEYGQRNLIVPASHVVNTDELPDLETIKLIIKNRVPVMERIIDFRTKSETWRFKK